MKIFKDYNHGMIPRPDPIRQIESSFKVHPVTGGFTVKIDGVILAAGFSERAGQFKPALDLGGKPILVRCIESMTETCDQTIVVAGFNVDRIHRR